MTTMSRLLKEGDVREPDDRSRSVEDRGVLKIVAAVVLLNLVLVCAPGCRSAAQSDLAPSQRATQKATAAVGASVTPSPSEPTATPNELGIVETARTIAEFAPAGWHTLKTADGDMNGDGRADGAAVFSKADPRVDKNDEGLREADAEAPRVLVLAFVDADGQLRRTGVSSRAVMCRRCGVMFDDPFIDLSVERGTIVLKQEVLGTSGYDYTHRFRYQDGGWKLIGETVEQRSRAAGDIHKRDANYLTGCVVVETGKVSDEQLQKRRSCGDPGELRSLAKFDIDRAATVKELR